MLRKESGTKKKRQADEKEMLTGQGGVKPLKSSAAIGTQSKQEKKKEGERKQGNKREKKRLGHTLTGKKDSNLLLSVATTVGNGGGVKRED